MARLDRTNPDRYLKRRKQVNLTYYYHRRVPKKVALLDARVAHLSADKAILSVSLETDDLALARAKRDILEQSDNSAWSLLLADDEDRAALVFSAARKSAQMLGLTYRSQPSLFEESSPKALFERASSAMEKGKGAIDGAALLGLLEEPDISIRDVFDVFKDEIAPGKMIGKSKAQKLDYFKPKQFAINSFVDVVGNLPVSEITRDKARLFYNHWLDRVAPKDGSIGLSGNTGNRRFDDVRYIFGKYLQHMGLLDTPNPFSNFSSFKEIKRAHPPYSTKHIIDVILKPGALVKLNREARGIVLALIETGARPSEIANILPGSIILDHKVPHIKIEPSLIKGREREIKTQASIRSIPLIGVALEVFKRHPNGFPRYRDKASSSLSPAVRKFFIQNNLRETEKHVLRSFRHSFKDRMTQSGLTDDFSERMLGHVLDHVDYGTGGGLEWQYEQLVQIALPFDPSIV